MTFIVGMSRVLVGSAGQPPPTFRTTHMLYLLRNLPSPLHHHTRTCTAAPTSRPTAKAALSRRAAVAVAVAADITSGRLYDNRAVLAR